MAEFVGLSPATVSAVINHSPASRSIPQETKDRILKAARELKYKPNFFARSLRQKRSFTVAVLVPELSEGYAATVLGGIEDQLLQEGYLYFVVSHRGRADLIDEYPRLLMHRGVEGFILINTSVPDDVSVPIVAIAGHSQTAGVTNVVVDNDKAGRLALEHLVSLGHRKIAFFKGHPWSSDTEPRWNAVCRAANDLGVEVSPELTVQLSGRTGPLEPSTPEEGTFYALQLLARRQPFTALIAFNDTSAIGAIGAFRDAGIAVPERISVVGFDDITAAAFTYPRLTTVRQPLHQMGVLAATTLLERITNPDLPCDHITVAPELVIRESTCPARDTSRVRDKVKTF